MPLTKEQLFARLLARTDTTADCWTTSANLNEWGYARIGFYEGGKRHWILAHRLAYEVAIGPIPVGLEIDHACKVPNCFRPLHLEAVSGRENRSRARPRQDRIPPSLARKVRRAARKRNMSLSEFTLWALRSAVE